MHAMQMQSCEWHKFNLKYIYKHLFETHEVGIRVFDTIVSHTCIRHSFLDILERLLCLICFITMHAICKLLSIVEFSGMKEALYS